MAWIERRSPLHNQSGVFLFCFFVLSQWREKDLWLHPFLCDICALHGFDTQQAGQTRVFWINVDALNYAVINHHRVSEKIQCNQFIYIHPTRTHTFSPSLLPLLPPPSPRIPSLPNLIHAHMLSLSFCHIHIHTLSLSLCSIFFNLFFITLIQKEVLSKWSS